MKLTSNNTRITDIELTTNMKHLSYFVDGKLVEEDGVFNLFGKNENGEYIGLRSIAAILDDDDNVIEEIYFEALFLR